jgi:hypothetical protein
MASTGRKVQVGSFGPDICFELLLDITREIGALIFPTKAFEGIMNEQKLKKIHQNAKEKELEVWKILSTHLKQLMTYGVMPTSTLVDIFVNAFLYYTPEDQRAQRKLREFLLTLSGTSTAEAASPRKDAIPASPPISPSKKSFPEKLNSTQALPAESSSILQSAFLRATSPNETGKNSIGTTM